MRSVSNLVERLGDEYDFRIVCLDRDSTQATPYPNAAGGRWVECGKAQVRYLAPGEASLLTWRSLAREVQADVVYLNSLLDRGFSILPMLAIGFSRRYRIVLAPRGELSLGALGLKAVRKSLFIAVARFCRSYSGVHWHATSETEVEDIRREFHPAGTDVTLASNLSSEPNVTPPRSAEKRAGTLRIVYLSRISPKKNLVSAIRMVARLSGDVTLDVWGPIGDVDYWKFCQTELASLPKHIRVTWRGEVPHERVADTLTNYDVFLLPTLGENFGHSIVEALTVGLPVVISDCTPWRHLREAGVGVDLPVENERAFVVALQQFQAMDEPSMVTMRDQCRAYIRRWREHSIDVNQYRSMFGTDTSSGSA